MNIYNHILQGDSRGSGTANLEFWQPDWPAPRSVCAVQTTRKGGHSLPPLHGLNLGVHVGDEPAAVAANRKLLRDVLRLPAEPAWLNQVHGTDVLLAEKIKTGSSADASWTAERGVVCVTQTADCLPVLFCDDAGSVVAAAHAGWRGLCAGMLENTVVALPVRKDTLMAWMGPAIGAQAFEVGEEVREAYLRHDAASASCFVTQGKGKYLCDIYALARQRLQAAGVTRIYGGSECTVSDSQRWFSHRRDGRSGRMATLIWLSSQTR